MFYTDQKQYSQQAKRLVPASLMFIRTIRINNIAKKNKQTRIAKNELDSLFLPLSLSFSHFFIC